MANLNKEQERAVRHIDGPCLVLAGPGSGKTFILVERIRHLIEDVGIFPREILVITFSKKAAVEMQDRFEKVTGEGKYPVYFGTFHAVFYNIVKDFYNLEKESVLTENIKIQYIGKILKKLKIEDKGIEYKTTILQAIGLHKIVNNQRKYESEVDESNIDESYLNKFFDSEDEIKIFYKIYDLYINFCRENKKIDFDDMLFMCKQILTENKSVLEKYRNIYKYFFVDEFQDINDVQYEILNLLAGERKNIFAVGDDDQSIYGFRGSNPKFMQKFIDDNINCEVIDMYRNYRCAECIIDYAGKLISNNELRIKKTQKASKIDKDLGSVSILRFENDQKEAEFILKELNNNLGSTAIIYRTDRCAMLLNETLKLNGINCIKAGGSNSYYDTEWVKDVVTYLRIAMGNSDASLLYRILNKPDRGLNRDSDLTIVRKKISLIKNLNPYAAVVFILRVLHYEDYLFERQMKKKSNKEEVTSMVNDLLLRAKSYKTIDEWIKTIDTINDQDIIDDSAYNVFMLTAHASKGLEFDTVFVIGLQEGIFPHRRAVLKEQIEEERRLLYVAMTRAKKKLYLLARGEEKYGKRISSFIEELV